MDTDSQEQAQQVQEQQVQAKQPGHARRFSEWKGRLVVAGVAAAAGLILLRLAGGGADGLPRVGSDPGALELPLLGGGSTNLVDLRGKVVLLDFWATWCPPCVASMPIVHRVGQELEERGVVTVAVNRDDVAPARREALVARFLERHGLAGLQVALDDGSAAGAFAVRGLPTLIVLGPDGRVAASHLGGIGEAELRDLLGPVVASAEGR